MKTSFSTMNNKYIYNKICQAAILKYDSGKLGIDDVTTTDEFVNE